MNMYLLFLCLSYNFFVHVTFHYAQLKIKWKDARISQVSAKAEMSISKKDLLRHDVKTKKPNIK